MTYERALTAFAVIAALAFGLYGRFTGLGVWSLGVDEFYISRSIDHVLATGLPKFECGGYYTRGILFQYSVALLRLLGLTPEFAGRVFSAAASVLMLPAAFLLGKRLAGRSAGWLCVIVLSMSVWEIEMARFARMYSLFQAVFAWYMVFFLRYAVDGKRSGLTGMIALSVIGSLSWEGGVFLGVANLLPPFLRQERGRLHTKDWSYLAAMLALLALLYASTIDLRGFADAPSPDDGLGDADAPPPSQRFTLGWAIVFLLPLAIAARSVGWIGRLRNRWLAALGLLAVLVAALAHQFLCAAFLITVLALLGIVDRRDASLRGAGWFAGAIGASFLFWLGYGIVTPSWHQPGLLTGLSRHLLGFPNVLEQVARPWARSIPHLGLGVAIIIGALTLATIQRPQTLAASRAPLVVLLTLVFAVGLNASPRIETRYTFFLYPLIVALCVAGLYWLARRILRSQPRAVGAAAAVVLIAFVASEDFQPAHVAHIDSARANFREGLSANTRDHYYPRSDMRGAAQWLSAHAGSNDLVIAGIPSLDPYYPKIDYFYLAQQDPRYEAYACGGGAVERWTQHRLLFTTSALDHAVESHARVFMVVYHDQVGPLQAHASLKGWSSALYKAASPGAVPILEITAGKAPAS